MSLLLQIWHQRFGAFQFHFKGFSTLRQVHLPILLLHRRNQPFTVTNPKLLLQVPSKMGFNTGEQSTLMADFLDQCGGHAVVDGGLATELERHGADLNDPLWSAKCLLSSPHLIRRVILSLSIARVVSVTQTGFYVRTQKPSLTPDNDVAELVLLHLTSVHLDYLEAGANIIISASYQATLQGFEAKGLSREEGESLLRRSVAIACEARDIYLDRAAKGSLDVAGNETILKKRLILVAASVGSYGAYLADGSEYSGVYGDAVTLETLKDFHRRRVQILAESGADLIAFETIPNKLEAKAYAELLEEEDIKIPAWFSFNSKDGINVVSGDSVSECASIADSCKQVVAVGINCTPPRYIHGLIQSIQKVTTKPVLVYPNSGETYDAYRKQWVPTNGVADEGFVSYVGKWHEAGASLIGGCCRTTPNTIRAISKILSCRAD